MEEIFLIQKTVLDPWENSSCNAVTTVSVGWVHTEAEAEKICENSQIFTQKDCWAIQTPIKELTYRRFVKLKQVENERNTDS